MHHKAQRMYNLILAVVAATAAAALVNADAAVVRSMLHRCIALGANVGARCDFERAHVRVNVY